MIRKALVEMLTVAIVLTMLIGCALTSSADDSITGIIRGDADMSGDVTITDATVIQRYLALLISKDEISLTASDANNDQSITITDATMIQRYLAQLSCTFGIGYPVEEYASIPQATQTQEYTEPMNENVFYIKANDRIFTADFSDNSSAKAFYELLLKGDLTISMGDYGNFEKVGQIGSVLPRNDSYITTEPGDVILYQGNSITIYYDTNSWSFTRIGKIRNATKELLLDAFGYGDVTVTFSLN